MGFPRIKVLTALAFLFVPFAPVSAETGPAAPPGTEQAPIQFRVIFKSDIDTTEAKAGDKVEGYLREDLKDDDQVVAPAGSIVLGHVEELTPSKSLAASVTSKQDRFRRHSSLKLTFDEIVTPSKQHIGIVGLADQQITIFNNHEIEIFRQITVGPGGELRKTENLDMFQIPELELALPSSAVKLKGHFQVHIAAGDELKVSARFVDDDASSTAVSGKIVIPAH